MKKLDRRTLLRGAAGAALSLPLLQIMGGPRASADAADGLVDGKIKRFVVVFKGNGVHQPSFFPGADGNFAGTNLAPVAAFQDRALVMDGVRLLAALESQGEQHQTGMGSLLSGRRLQNTGEFVGGDGTTAGWGNGVTIDQVIASRIQGTTPFKSLELGVRANLGGSEIRTRMVYRGPGDPISPLDDPRQVFDRLFTVVDANAEERERIRMRQQRVVDAIQEQYRQVSGRVGRTDRLRLERHLSFINDLESRLGRDGGLCEPPSIAESYGTANMDVPAISRAQIDLMVAAFTCDLTRVASLQYSTGKYHIRHPWADDTSDGHTLGHGTARLWDPVVDPSNPEKSNNTRMWNRRVEWYMGEIAYLLEQLEATPEGEGTLLDSTAVLFVSENSNPHHYLTRMPFVLFGDAGGAFQSGIQRYGDPQNQSTNENHNRLLIALARGYGVEIDEFGEPEYCEGGALPGVLV